MTYAIISLGGKQYRVREGERLLVDRLDQPDGKSFHPPVLLLGGSGATEIAPSGTPVTARVVKQVLGKKVRIGKYKPKKGYRRHTGYRSRLSQVEIEAIGAKGKAESKRKATKKETAQAGSEKAE